MEQITQYFEHMDYVSFGVIALPCVIIAIYGFLQVASGLAKGKNDKMQRCNNTNSNNNSNSNSNNGNSGSNNSKRCTQKYANGNMAATTAAAAATAATATTTAANGYQQNNNSNKSNATRKSRYNSNNNSNNNIKRQDGSAYNMQQKRSNAAGSDATWHRFVTSSCIEEKFLSQHNPGHRNSTSSEATSEDIHSSDEQPGKAKNRSINGHGNGGSNSAGNTGNGGKSRSKRQQKSQAVKQALNRTQVTSTSTSVQVEVQPLEVQPAIKVNNSSNGNGSKCKQGKWRNSNNVGNNIGNSNSNININSCGSNQKRSSSNNNNKSKQTKCNSKTSGNNSNSNTNNSNSSNNNINNRSSSSINGKSSVSYCGSNSSNSSSALSSPGSSPNSNSGNSSSGNSSCHSSSSSSSINKINHSNNSWQYKSYKQNVNFLVPPLHQYERLDLDDATLHQQLQRYIIEPHLLRVYGFPVESVVHEGAIEIFKCLPHMNFAAAHVMAVTETALTVINCHDGLNTSNFEYSQCPEISTDNEIGSEELEASPASTSTDSGNISPRSLDSESGGEWSGSECESSSPTGLELYCNYGAQMERSLAKQCVRCKHDFLVDELSGQYLTREECSYHWGKYHRCYDGNAWISRWTCCSANDESAVGCTRHDLHVWTGSVVGVNGPYRDFVHTRPNNNRNNSNNHRAVYALDCEMSYTGRGLDVTKVSLVAMNGQLVYEHYVRPDADIVDYNTRYSGVTAKDLKSSGVKTLAEVQRDLLELIDADTILIGHGLDNDLRALRLVHNTLIDTSIAFPHSSGFPYRRALRHLTKTHLNREIQSGDGATGHSSFEDSRACMELMLWRVRCELDSDASWED